MQLGTRWTVGARVPQGVPPVMAEAISGVEDELTIDGLDASTWRWTLTWLEGRPVAMLDDGTTVRLDPATGDAVVEPPPE